MTIDWDLITTILGSGVGGILLTKVYESYFLPKKDEKEFDKKVRNELWDRVKYLEGRIDEQNKLLVEIMKENSQLKTRVQHLRSENTQLKEDN